MLASLWESACQLAFHNHDFTIYDPNEYFLKAFFQMFFVFFMKYSSTFSIWNEIRG